MNFRRKLILAFFTLCIMAFSVCSASFLDDNPNRYVKLDTTPKSTVYVDTSSINVIRYEPPYYVIQVNDYFVNYEYGIIKLCVDQYFYNYSDRTIERKVIDGYAYTSHGTIESHTHDRTGLIDLPDHSVGWDIGNYIFHKSYNMYFSPELQERFGNK